MKKTGFTILILFAVLFLTACKKDDGYVYPPVITEILCARTSSAGTVDYLDTDGGKVYKALNGDRLKGLSKDSVYRVYCVYELSPEVENGATLYSLVALLSPDPVKANRFPGGIKTDPLTVVSVWKSAGYINLSVDVMSQDLKKHRFHFVDDGIEDKGTYKILNLTLYHDQGGDVEAYNQNIYLSVPLENYNKVLAENDSILFHINTFKGKRTYRLSF